MISHTRCMEELEIPFRDFYKAKWKYMRENEQSAHTLLRWSLAQSIACPAMEGSYMRHMEMLSERLWDATNRTEKNRRHVQVERRFFVSSYLEIHRRLTVIGGEYLHKKSEYKDMHIPVEQFTAKGGYYQNFLSDRRKTFFLLLGLSALAGYETSNRGDKLLPGGGYAFG